MEDAQRCRRAAGRLAGKLRRACRRWQLLPEGGGVAVGLSGGRDSLALVALLADEVRFRKPQLALTALHVHLDAGEVGAPLPEGTRRWCEERGVRVRVVEPRLGPGDPAPTDCFGCARIRRRALLEAAETAGCRVLALGHHADDVVETWLLSLFYTGRAEVLAPRRSYFDGAVELVRPLIELRRAEIHRLARLCGFPAPPAPCPHQDAARRDRVRAVLAALGRDERTVRRHLYWAAMREVSSGTGGNLL